jgi:hypothetical protein
MHSPRWLLEEGRIRAPITPRRFKLHPPVSRRSFHAFAPLLHGGGFTSQPPRQGEAAGVLTAAC